jgi:hypothetical protein
MESWGIVRTTCPPDAVVPAKPGMRRGGSASTFSRVSTLPWRSAWSVMIVLLVVPGKQSKLRMTASACAAPSAPSFPTALSHAVWRTLPSVWDRVVSTLNCQAPVAEPPSHPPQAATDTMAERIACSLSPGALVRHEPAVLTWPTVGARSPACSSCIRVYPRTQLVSESTSASLSILLYCSNL